jgi:hypothetical protein
MTNNLKFINVEENTVPDSVKNVPTILGGFFTKPLVGRKVFDWVENMQFFNRTSNNVNLTRTIQMPKDSELLHKKSIEYDPRKNYFCTLEESKTLLL